MQKRQSECRLKSSISPTPREPHNGGGLPSWSASSHAFTSIIAFLPTRIHNNKLTLHSSLLPEPHEEIEEHVRTASYRSTPVCSTPTSASPPFFLHIKKMKSIALLSILLVTATEAAFAPSSTSVRTTTTTTATTALQAVPPEKEVGVLPPVGFFEYVPSWGNALHLFARATTRTRSNRWVPWRKSFKAFRDRPVCVVAVWRIARQKNP